MRAGGFSPLEPINCLLGCGQWGVSPLARKALASFDPGDLAAYPERFHETLLAPAVVERFAAHGVQEDQLFFGHGSFNILERVVHKLVRPGRMVGVGPQFGEIPFEWKLAGGTYEPLPLAAPDYAPAHGRDRARARGRAGVDRLRRQPEQPAGAPLPAGRDGAPRRVLRPSIGDPGDRRGARRLPRRRALVRGAHGEARERDRHAVVLEGPRPRRGARGLRVLLAAPRPVLPPGRRAVRAGARRGDARPRDAARPRRSSTPCAATPRRRRPRSCARFATPGSWCCPPTPRCRSSPSTRRRVTCGRLLRSRGILVQPGSSFGRTHPGWDDTFGRLRVVSRALVPSLCERIRSLQ